MKRRSRAIVALTGRRSSAALGVRSAWPPVLCWRGPRLRLLRRPGQRRPWAGRSCSAAARASTGQRPDHFRRFDPALGDFSIWAANPDGTHQQRLTHVPSFFSDWSPDGRRIAFDFSDKTGEHLATMDPTAASAPAHLRERHPGRPQVVAERAADHLRGLAGRSPVSRASTPDIWTMRPDGTGARRLTHGAFGVEPVFSPDGRQIAFGRITTMPRSRTWPSTSWTPTAPTSARSCHRRSAWNTPTGPPTAPGSPSTSPPKHRTQR